MTIRIDALAPTVNPNRDHEFPAMREQIAVKLRIEQILGLIQRGDLPADVLASLDLADSALQAIADASITNANLSDMDEARFKMRPAGAGTGAPTDGTATEALAALGISLDAIPKAIVELTNLTGTPTITPLYNELGTLSATRTGTGNYLLSWVTALVSGGYVFPMARDGSPKSARLGNIGTTNTAQQLLVSEMSAGAASDPTALLILIYGDA